MKDSNGEFEQKSKGGIMSYKCLDAGSERCPCHLIEWGECYTCQMASGGRCDCGGGRKWSGVCPFSEYLLNGKKPGPYFRDRTFAVSELKRYSGDLSVLHLDVTPGFAQKCSRPGAFVMVKSLGYQIPLSVIKAEMGMNSFIEIAVLATGPKTKSLIYEAADCEKCHRQIEMKGPFYSGLVNHGLLNLWKKEQSAISIAVRGMALAPLINCLEWIYGSLGRATEKIDNGMLLIDYGRLPEKFFIDYLGENLFERSRSAHFNDGMEDVFEMATKTKGVIFLASPYFTDIFRNEYPELAPKTVFANHANMCCGEGLCGSCSYVDPDGVTVKKCKCIY